MRKAINTEHIEGYIYQHNLVIKTVGNKESKNFGKEYISGTIDIATSEDGLNIVPVHYSYEVQFRDSGSENKNYSILKKIIDEGKTWIKDGKEEAFKVKVDSAIALNEFYASDGRFISTKVNEGGFISLASTLKEKESERNTFTEDMVIMSTTVVEADPEKDIKEDYMVVKGLIFNFRKEILPVDFIVRDQEGMNYFESLEASQKEPVYTKVWGKINSSSTTKEIKEDSAFGEESVRTFEKKVRDWVITGASKVAYDFGDENVLTMKEIEEAAQNREIKLADLKKRTEDSKNKAAAPAPAAPTITASKETFNF